jgi:citrate lyase beta subunit
MVDKPIVTRAERVLDLARAAGISVDEGIVEGVAK